MNEWYLYLVSAPLTLSARLPFLHSFEYDHNQYIDISLILARLFMLG